MPKTPFPNGTSLKYQGAPVRPRRSLFSPSLHPPHSTRRFVTLTPALPPCEHGISGDNNVSICAARSDTLLTQSRYRYGPIFIGVVFNVLLYGIMITQTFLYFTTYKKCVALSYPLR